MTIAGLVDKGAAIVDVGADHAYLTIHLVKSGAVCSAVATDVRAGPLSRADEHVRRYGVAEQVTLVRCDGLSAVDPNSVDTVIIAGMGGETIAEILRAAGWQKRPAHTYLLQPMTAAAELRTFLTQNGFTIVRECLCAEGRRFYNILKAVPGQSPPLTISETHAGVGLTDEALFPAYIDLMINAERRRLDCLEAAGRDAPRTLLDGLTEMKK